MGENTTNPAWRVNSRACVCSCSWVWTRASPTACPEGLWVRRVCASIGTPTIHSRVWMNKRERRREFKRKIQTNPLDAWASQGRGRSQPQGFPTLDGGRLRSPRPASAPRVMHGKGHLRKANQRPGKSNTGLDGGHRKEEKNNKQVDSVIFHKEIAKVTPPLRTHLGEVYCWRLGY